MTRKHLIVSYAFHVFNAVFAALNAVMAVINFETGRYWWSALSAGSFLLILCAFVYGIRNHVRYARHWREENRRFVEMEIFTSAWQLANAPVGRSQITGMPLPHWMAKQQLDECLRTNTCPDCGEQSLDKERMECISSGCGSRFKRSKNGEWSRLDGLQTRR